MILVFRWSRYHQRGGSAVFPGRISFRCRRRTDRHARTVAKGAQAGRAGIIAGHFGFAAAVKSREPETPLWALMLATVWLDVLFVPLYVAGIETTQLADKGHTGYGAN